MPCCLPASNSAALATAWIIWCYRHRPLLQRAKKSCWSSAELGWIQSRVWQWNKLVVKSEGVNRTSHDEGRLRHGIPQSTWTLVHPQKPITVCRSEICAYISYNHICILIYIPWGWDDSKCPTLQLAPSRSTMEADSTMRQQQPWWRRTSTNDDSPDRSVSFLVMDRRWNK